MNTSLKIYATPQHRLDYGPMYAKVLSHRKVRVTHYKLPTYNTDKENRQYGLKIYYGNKHRKEEGTDGNYKIIKQLYEIP